MRTPLRRLLLPVALLVVAAPSALAPMAATAQITGPQPPLPTVRLTAGMHVITAELAADHRARMVGLMFREQLAPNHGMLFVFDVKTRQCMWMRNTLIPLSVAFLDDDGTIVNIEDMAPKTEVDHCSQRPVRYALEMDRGWFAQRGLKAGARLSGLPAPSR
jgi:uncharacterized membrane protein (UPF0127 family)